MERDRTHQIQEAAERYFRNAVPLGWATRTESPDYGIDYRVQLFKPKAPAQAHDRFATTVPTPYFFAAQVKGTESFNRLRDGTIAFVLETHRLAYYVDNERLLPSFLVLVDVSNDESVWLFLQKHALERLQGRSWRQKETVTLHVPSTNVFAAKESGALRLTDEFKEAVVDGVDYMTILRPAAPKLAVVAEERRLESIDPRFGVRVSATSSGVHRTFTLKRGQAVSIDINLAHSPERHEAFLLGKSVTIDPGEISIDSPLFARLSTLPCEVQAGRRFRVEVRMAPRAATGAAHVYSAVGQITAGIAGASYESTDGKSILKITTSFRFDQEAPRGELNLNIDMTSWAGRPVLRLPQFEQLEHLFVSASQGQEVELCTFVDNELVSTEHFALPVMPYWIRLIDALQKARELARRFSLDISFPEQLRNHHVEQIEKLYALATTGEYRDSGAEAWMDFTVAAGKLELQGLDEGAHDLRIAGNFPETFSFLGTPVCVAMHEVRLTEAVLASERDRLLRENLKGDVKVNFVGTRKSEWVMKSERSIMTKHESDRRFGRIFESADATGNRKVRRANAARSRRATSRRLG